MPGLNILISDLMTKNILTVSPDDSVLSTAISMKEKNIGSAIVLVSGKPVGIVTERDLAFKIIPEKKDASIVRVKEIMVSPVATVRADSDIIVAAELMQEKRFRRLLVVGKSGELLGIITQTDLASVEPDIVRLMEDLLSAREAKKSNDPIQSYHQERKLKDDLAKIRGKRKNQ